ncbi:hypothetical protein Bca4012_030956 [Brassica carinata]
MLLQLLASPIIQRISLTPYLSPSPILCSSQRPETLLMLQSVLAVKLNAGCPASIVSNDEFDSSSLPHEDAILFVVSTTGQGDSPDSFKEFWRFLLQRNLGNSWLQRVCFAVFGLGDSGYQKYNFVTKKLDKRLLDLGATTIIEKGLGDDEHPSWYETRAFRLPELIHRFTSIDGLKRLRNRASLKISGQQAQNSNPLPEFVNQGLLLWNQTNLNISWNAASYDSLKNAEVMSPPIIVSHCPHDGGLLFFMGRSCINV